MTTLPDWLSKRIELTPHKVALEILTESQTHYYSWREVSDLISTVADLLAERGVRAGECVAVLMGNGLPYFLTIHALIQLRAILVPLNARLTAAEIAWQLDDAGATLLVTDREHATLAEDADRSGAKREILIVPPDPEPISAAALPRSSIHLSDVHAVVYTSGTTGKPKGVTLTYGNHWWSATGSALNLGVREEDKWLLVLPLFHVGGLSMLFKSVIYGNTLRLHERFDAAAVNHALEHDGVTHISLVATMLRRILNHGGGRPYPESLRAILLGGAPCPAPLLERCLRLGVPVVQSYGMTESASQAATLAPGDAARKPGSSGKALFPVALKIETEGREALAREVGEIVLKGATITPGYWKRPDATAAAMREGWLYTGDLGYLDDEGYLFVVNRRTDLIISGGENIYPAEIEAALLAHEGVAEALVVGIPDEEWGQRVAAAVVTLPESDITPDALRTFLMPRLAKYKIPRDIRFFPELPRNAGGKVLRDAVVASFAN